MKTLLLALAIFSPNAQAEKLVVHGIEFDAAEISYFHGPEKKVHSFRPLSPQNFPFNRGNLFPAQETVYLHTNGNISSISSWAKEPVRWALPSGDVLPLLCGAKPNPFGQPVARMVGFHANGEYRNGCALENPVAFKAGGSVVKASGSIDLNIDFSLAYATNVAEGSIQLGSREIPLVPGSEIAFYENSRPRFFTMPAGQSFEVNQAKFGPLTFIQKSDRPVSTSLFENGWVERGIVGQPIPFAPFKITIAAGSGVSFDKKGEVDFAILSESAQVFAINNDFWVDRVGLNPENRQFEGVTVLPFTFKSPDGRLIDIPPGSVVTLSRSLEILSIRSPKVVVPFKRIQLEL